MARLGTERRPAVVRVQSEQRAAEIIPIFDDSGWQLILGVEPGMPEDIADLERPLYPPEPVGSQTVGRNERCPCGSGKKHKHCCGV